MIVLDTNIVSEPDRPRPSERVLAWLDANQDETVCITALTIAELAAGAERVLLRSGSSRYLNRLKRIEVEFVGRILSVDAVSAQTYGRIRARREHTGRPIKDMDALIAAICLAHGATLATRNVRDFEGLDLTIVNPFEAEA